MATPGQSHSATSAPRATSNRPGDDRLEMLESREAIRQLVARYALAVDSRDLDLLVSLFEPDVRVGRDSFGRDALRSWFDGVLGALGATVHFVGNHVIDLVDADHASGVVYCYEQLELPEAGRWEHGMLQYWDDYRRIDTEWYFHRRRFYRWRDADGGDHAPHRWGVEGGASASGVLPGAFPTWSRFWADRPTGDAAGGSASV